ELVEAVAARESVVAPFAIHRDVARRVHFDRVVAGAAVNDNAAEIGHVNGTLRFAVHRHAVLQLVGAELRDGDAVVARGPDNEQHVFAGDLRIGQDLGGAGRDGDDAQGVIFDFAIGCRAGGTQAGGRAKAEASIGAAERSRSGHGKVDEIVAGQESKAGGNALGGVERAV